MFMPITETVRSISPLTSAIAYGIVNTLDSVLTAHRLRREEKQLSDIARRLKVEYPYESPEYVELLVRNGRESDVE